MLLQLHESVGIAFQNVERDLKKYWNYFLKNVD
jgi:hypothetical protein